MKSFTVVISALNEESNIAGLIQDILDQEFSDKVLNKFFLEKIIIISDGSTDKTVEIVKNFQKMSGKITLLINRKRIGKIFSLSRAFNFLKSDYVLLFDADVRLKKDTINLLLDPLLLKHYDLIGGNPVPMYSNNCFNFAEQGSYFSWLLLREIKKYNVDSIYCAHGRVLLLSSNLYRNLNITNASTPGDDQFIYLNCNHSFFYAKSAIVYYKLPKSIGDYLKQNNRYRKAKQKRISSGFEKDLIRKEFYIRSKYKIVYNLLFSEACYKMIIWLFLYLVGYIRFKLYLESVDDFNKFWGEVKSTKK